MACFPVRDESIELKWNSPFYKWLEEEGFETWVNFRGYSDYVDWAYVNLQSKVYSPGIIGVPVTSVVCDHAITIDEFKTIYGIYKKYEGLDLLRMTADEQRKRYLEEAAAERANERYWAKMTYEKYYDEIKEKLIDGYKFSPEEAVKLMNDEEETVKEQYKGKYVPESVAYLLFMLR